MALIGDSHVKRLERTGVFDFFVTRGWALTCYATGGAKVSQNYLERYFAPADIGIIMLGSNDLDDGMPANELLMRLVDRANRFLYTGTFKHVIIMGLWPRNSRIFNNRARYFNSLGWNLYGNAGITFWQWSRKLTVRLCADGVHGFPNVYRRAVRFVLSAVLWVSKTKMRRFFFFF